MRVPHSHLDCGVTKEFLDSLKIFFPNLYDIKYLMLSTDNLMGGLQSGEYCPLIGQDLLRDLRNGL